MVFSIFALSFELKAFGWGLPAGGLQNGAVFNPHKAVDRAAVANHVAMGDRSLNNAGVLAAHLDAEHIISAELGVEGVDESGDLVGHVSYAVDVLTMTPPTER